MKKSGDMENMLTVVEVARLLHLHPNTIRRWNNQGLIKAYRLGPLRVRRFLREDISDFLKNKADYIDKT